MGWQHDFLEEIEDISRKKKMKDYHSFLFWYIKATEAISDEEIEDIIVDRSRDAGCDAIFIDHNMKLVKIFQSKFTKNIALTAFNKDELLKITKIVDYLQDRKSVDDIRGYVHDKLKDKLDKAVRYIVDEGYKPKLIFITTHKQNPNNYIYINKLDIPINIITSFELKRKYEEWNHGHSPELGEVELNYQDILFGPKTLKSVIVNIPCKELKNVYLKFKNKLFSRNVRIFYEKTKPNRAIKMTLKDEPQYFWYYNNGITILAEKIIVNNDEKIIKLLNPQIINGCQTVTQIGENSETNAILSAKIIEVKDSIINQQFIDSLIEANNRQNPVDERILKSNHPLQVRLQRNLEYLGYYYERKEHQYKQESKRSSKISKLTKINNKELVQANLIKVKEPHFALTDSEEDLFSIRFSTIFYDDKRPLEYLIPYLLWKKIVSIGNKYKKNYNRRRFHKLCSFHVLRILFDFCPDLRKRSELNKIFSLLSGKRFEFNESPIKDILNIAYQKFKKSKYVNQDSGQRDFFKSRDTYEIIKNAINKTIQKKIKNLFLI
ncbi:MAG: AIPR family protein [Promethearchaeota archaeon]